MESICTQVQLTIFFLKLLYLILMPKTKGGRKNRDFFFWGGGHVPYQAGGEWFDPHPAKKTRFFHTKCKKYLACPENFFLL